ncbi:MAG: hypothetical protein MJ071_05610 [Oscillospiraceae bacterium]|nr:hypothetical protein [Oscillospiraceae bacterium]
MKPIEIQVSGQIAKAKGQPIIICGNSDISIVFSFDKAWDDYPLKTARFIYCRHGKLLHTDVLFSGSICSVPVFQDISSVAVGVYAGNLISSTVVTIPCEAAILMQPHPAPPSDIYLQLLDYLQNNTQRIGSAVLSAMGFPAAETPAIPEREELL